MSYVVKDRSFLEHLLDIEFEEPTQLTCFFYKGNLTKLLFHIYCIELSCPTARRYEKDFSCFLARKIHLDNKSTHYLLLTMFIFELDLKKRFIFLNTAMLLRNSEDTAGVQVSK